jgi:hypothetical protein
VYVFLKNAKYVMKLGKIVNIEVFDPSIKQSILEVDIIQRKIYNFFEGSLSKYLADVMRTGCAVTYTDVSNDGIKNKSNDHI